jgi:putative DNA primase/helicase
MATLDQAIAQMVAAGMPPFPDGGPRLSGRIVRYGKRSRAWYVLHEYQARNGKRYVHGAFGIWGQFDAVKIESDYQGMDPEEAERLRRAQAGREADEQRKRAERARFAANRAKQQWDAARASLPDGGCPYLTKKGVATEKGLRFFKDGTLLVPMVRYDVTEAMEQDASPEAPRRLAGVQKIAPDGEKRFNKGMAKAGTACRLGKAPRDGQPILLCEGLATGLSIRQAMEQSHAVFVAFDAGNLTAVAKILRGLFPASPLVLCADDDAYLVAQMNRHLRDDWGASALMDVPRECDTFRVLGREFVVRAGVELADGMVPLLMGSVTHAGGMRPFVFRNAGRTAAHEAARAVGNASVCFPVFAARALALDPEAPRLTDFNDLHAAEGLAVVAAQLREALSKVTFTPDGAAAPGEKRVKAGKGAGGDQGGGGDEPNWELHGALLARFTQIYPSDEAFDEQIGRIVKVQHMRLMFGNRAVSMWLAAKKKRVVLLEDVVFDPTVEVKPGAQPSGRVNLFRGLEMAPSKNGSCTKLLALLHYLCGEHPEDTEAPLTTWCLRWAAFPLQHRGAKMQTAVVMYGEEGTGKNLFWGALRSIYGQHGGTITQMQLQSQFNDWLSAKLFLIANEVVTRAELKHLVGVLKNLVTEREIWINPKHLGGRSESNHCNMVFLSNELQPMLVGQGDRRNMVIKTPRPASAELYAAVGEEIAHGGAQALYQYLLELDLGDFDENAKPPMTEAKQTLIEMGMVPSQLFWTELHEGLLGLPYGPCLVTDLYRAYVAWCFRNGHRVPEALNRFKPAFMAMNGVRAKIERIQVPSAKPMIVAEALRQHRIFVMGESEADADAERRRIHDGINKFHFALEEYLGGEAKSGGDVWPQEARR